MVYRGWRERDNLPILKVLKQDYPAAEELIRYKQEYQIASSFAADNIIKAYCLEKYQNTLAIVLEDFGGKSLDIYLKEDRFTIEQILEIALKITSGIAAIHAVNIIHKDINPSNIIFNPDTGQTKIIDFGISSILPRENPLLKNPYNLEGTLAYISPEQTGRMNRCLDRRSDLYSLGITLYELLTKQLPFQSKDPLELIHSHIAVAPRSPQELNPKIPQIFADIVLKLMAKNAENRYQTAWGLKADLAKCLEEIKRKDRIEYFVLGKEDLDDRLQISSQIYGREAEIEQLLTGFDDRVKSGRKEIYLVAGYAGVGKTTLVNEIRKLIIQQRGYFISRKFEQYQRDIPYSGFINPFKNLISQLPSETEIHLETWKQKLLAALGNNAQLIVDLIPEIELIIGSQPEILELGINEAENRFNLVLPNFVGVFVSKEHPLVIFLDDLQWADSASLKLIKLLITNPDIEHLLLIGAYRNNEVDLTHPLTIACSEIQKNSIFINIINLKPLMIEDIERLIADSLNSTRSISKDLAKLLLNKTNGNPFFLSQLLQYLHHKELISFNYELKSWEWDIEEIKGIGVTDNVVQLTIEKIPRLDESSQNILKLAACIGNTFNFKILSVINKKSISVTAKELWSALESGLILPLNNNYKIPLFSESEKLLIGSEAVSYKFLHDRVQQAAYTLIPEAQKKQIHLQIGRLLLENIKPEELEENIFDLVDRLNISRELIKIESELEELAKLNLIAGKKAKSSAAYQTALKHLQIGIELLKEDSWKSHYELTLSLYLEAIAAAYLTGNDFDLMECWSSIVLKKAKTLLDCVKVYEIKMLAYIAQNNLPQAIETGLLILNKLGVNLPKNPSKFKIFLELLWTRLNLIIKLTLTGKQIKDLIELPIMSDPYKIAAMDILHFLATATYLANPSLCVLVGLKGVQLSIKYGNTASSALAYITYAWILCELLKDLNTCYQFAQLSLFLAKKLTNKKYKSSIIANTLLDFYSLIIHWVEGG